MKPPILYMYAVSPQFLIKPYSCNKNILSTCCMQSTIVSRRISLYSQPLKSLPLIKVDTLCMRTVREAKIKMAQLRDK